MWVQVPEVFQVGLHSLPTRASAASGYGVQGGSQAADMMEAQVGPGLDKGMINTIALINTNAPC